VNPAASRQAIVDRVLATPPAVHHMSYEDCLNDLPVSGVWSTEESCYRFLAEQCQPGNHTLETGSGVSTILFAAWGAVHTCVTPGPEEAEAVIAYCKSQGISTDSLTIEVAYSDDALPRFTSGPALDMVLIDGSHGFPAPIIDWYYGAGRLRGGGLLVVDDLQLPAVRILKDFLDRDPRWNSIRQTSKWAAYRRGGEGTLNEDWFMQPFYTLPEAAWRKGVSRVERTARRILGPVKRTAMRRLRRA
jgi:predicted O-methyltransferase YrrM